MTTIDAAVARIMAIVAKAREDANRKEASHAARHRPPR